MVRLILLGTVIALIFFALFGFLASRYMNLAVDQRLDNLKEMVRISRNTIEPILIQYRKGNLSKNQTLVQVRNLVRRMTYRDHVGKNYIFMSSYDGTMLVQPYEPKKEIGRAHV